MVALIAQSWMIGAVNYGPNPGQFQPGEQTNELQGHRFGRLTVISRAENNKHRSAMWNCRCDCGATGVFKGRNLWIGKTKSCGCWLREPENRYRKHGCSPRKGPSSEWMAWKAMRQRCSNANHPQFRNYGGRGITVCQRWSEFANFIQDMGRKPSEGLSIERIDNNKGYSKENCIWATRRAQNRNRRNNLILTHSGRSQTLTDWANECGLKFNTLYFRVLRGWPMEKALVPPVKRGS